MKVNLLKETNNNYSINWLEIIAVICVVLFFGVIGFNYYNLYSETSFLRAEIENLDSQLSNINLKVIEYRKLENKVKELEVLKENLEALRYVWNDAVKEQGFVIPRNTMLYSLEIEENKLLITGRGVNNQQVLQLISNMKNSAVYREVKLINLNQSDDTEFSIQAIVDGGDD
jgi:Tfp pilus assembly protein PilN